ncbi:MAG: tetratricopeptide repeat protein [Candidatus Schekmanbacteria bacterium]|nr:tetratricopeptide repeat protein [Candidatus Schekmanbacteria bacterium]
MRLVLIGFSSAFLAIAGLASPVQAAGISAQILSATVKDQAIDGAEVILQRTGEASARATTDSAGKVTFAVRPGGVDDGTLTMIVKKPGYSNLVVKCPCDAMTYALSPAMSELDAMRIVLNWGATPADLDSHLAFAGEHVFFDRRAGSDAELDVDDVDSYGPETVTVQKKRPGVKYLYAVHNYTEGETKGSLSLSNVSQARVYVYVGSSQVRTFVPPKARAGNVWVVFGIGDNGELYDINKFTDVPTREGVGASMSELIARGSFVSLPDVSVDQKKLAEELNRQGEAAYHETRIEDAVALYLEAIDNDPEHGQAYSNLGLAYQKLSRPAEAIWANRKAIAIATGPTSATVRASSHYNIARVYEELGRYQQALEDYEQALANKERDAYKSGIERMKVKLVPR